MADGTRSRNKNGQFTPEVDDSELLAAVDQHDLAGTSDVGDAVNLARQNADYRLRQLAEQDLVNKRKIGGTLVWSLTDSGEEVVERDLGEEGLPEIDPEDELTRDDITHIVQNLDIQGSDEYIYERYACLTKVLEELKRSGTKEAKDLKSIVEPINHGFEDADSFWANTWRRDALPELKEIGLIENKENSGEYRWVPVVWDGSES